MRLVVVLCSLAVLGHALPVDPRKDKRAEKIPDMPNRPLPDEVDRLVRRRMPDTPGLDTEEYNRYWAEMTKDNPALREHLKKLNPEQLAQIHPRMSEKVARDAQDIRNRLEEARRMNLDEMRELQRLQTVEEKDRRVAPDSEWVARQQAIRDHLPENYNKEDIQRRIDEQRRILEDIDQRRREDFEQYQMMQEHQRREKLKTMNEPQRLKEEQVLRERREQMQHHERMNQPASKKQLEEVWEEDDGLKDEEFDPRTFFFLHDTNGDKRLDAMELQALFYNEVKKAYGNNADNMQTQEELARMREFALKEMDRDNDLMISLQEFMSYAQGAKFEENEEWKPVAGEEEAFTEEEMKKFEEDYEDYYDYEYDEHGNIIGLKTLPTDPPSVAQPPVPDVGREMKGDPDTDQNTPSLPTASDGLRGEQQQQGQQELGHEVNQQAGHQEEGVPGEKDAQGEDEGLPGQEQLHIQPAGTQKEGQAQQFNKNAGGTL